MGLENEDVRAVAADDVAGTGAGGRRQAADARPRAAVAVVGVDSRLDIPFRDRPRGIRTDVIPLDQRGIAAVEQDAESVGGDDVACRSRRAADHGALRVIDEDPVGIPVAGGAIRFGPDVVALHDVVARGETLDVDAVEAALVDDDPRGGGRAADRVVRGPGEDADAVSDICQRSGAGRVDADEVALDDVARGAGAVSTTAALVLPPISLAEPGAVPPIVLPEAPVSISTPSVPLATAAVPAALVPMRFPSTRLPVVPAPRSGRRRSCCRK